MISDVVVDFCREVLIVWPGAIIRWLWFGRKKSIADFANEDSPYNYILSFFLIAAIGITIAVL